MIIPIIPVLMKITAFPNAFWMASDCTFQHGWIAPNHENTSFSRRNKSMSLQNNNRRPHFAAAQLAV